MRRKVVFFIDSQDEKEGGIILLSQDEWEGGIILSILQYGSNMSELVVLLRKST